MSRNSLSRNVKYLIAAVFTALALIVGGLGAGSASAAVSHDSCVTGGTTVSTTLFYSVNGASRSVSNYGWSTSPAAQLNRIALDLRDDGASYLPRSAAGGSTATLNDVPSSESGYSSSLPLNLSGGGYEYRFRIWGGVGNSTDSCNTGWHGF